MENMRSGGRKSPHGLQKQSPGREFGGRSPPESETLLLNEHAIFIAYLNKNPTAHMIPFQKFVLHICNSYYTFCAQKYAILGST